MKKYDGRASLAITGVQVEVASQKPVSDDGSGCCNWEMLREMQESGVFEITSKSYHMNRREPRKGMTKKIDETNAEYIQAIINDNDQQSDLLQTRLGKSHNIIVYPYAIAISQDTADELIKRGIKLFVGVDNNSVSTIYKNDSSVDINFSRSVRDVDSNSSEAIEQLLKQVSYDTTSKAPTRLVSGSIETRDKIGLPVVIYHRVLPSNHKDYSDLAVTPEMFDEDMRYISNAGYTTVFFSDIINYVKEKRALPEKSIIVSFDDGYLNNYIYAMPILYKHNMKAVLAVIGSQIDKASTTSVIDTNGGYLNWNTLKFMESTNIFEIISHTDDLHLDADRHGMTKLPGETDEEHLAVIVEDLLNQKKAFHKAGLKPPTVIVYPYGLKIEKPTIEKINKMGVDSLAIVGNTPNIVQSGDNTSLLELGRYYRLNHLDRREFFDKMFEENLLS